MIEAIAAAILALTAQASGAHRITESHARSYARIVVAEADRHDLDPWVLVALVDRESSWKPRAVNETTGAVGLGQILASPEILAGGFAQFADQLADPAVNLFLTARWLARWRDKCGGNIGRALDAYNGQGIKRRALSSFARGVLSEAERLR